MYARQGWECIEVVPVDSLAFMARISAQQVFCAITMSDGVDTGALSHRSVSLKAKARNIERGIDYNYCHSTIETISRMDDLILRVQRHRQQQISA